MLFLPKKQWFELLFDQNNKTLDHDPFYSRDCVFIIDAIIHITILILLSAMLYIQFLVSTLS